MKKLALISVMVLLLCACNKSVPTPPKNEGGDTITPPVNPQKEW